MDASLHTPHRPARLSLLAPLALGLLVLLGLSGCLSTQLIDEWRDPAFHGTALQKVLVVGIQRDQGRRRVWEDSMVAALARFALAAVPSYQVFPDRAPSADQLAASATRDGFDGVIATHFVGGSTRYYWVPGYAGVGFGWRWRYFGYWDAAYAPGYVEPEHLSDYQTDVFTVGAAGDKLVWTGITRSLDLSSLRSATDEISRVLVPALQRAGLLTTHKT